MSDPTTPETPETPAPDTADGASGGPSVQILITVGADQAMHIQAGVPSQDVLEAVLLRALSYIQRQQLVAAIKRADGDVRVASRMPGGKPTLMHPFPGRI